MPVPTAQEIYDQVQTERPHGWRRFTVSHAHRVRTALDRRGKPGGVSSTYSIDGELSEQSVLRLADQVRTNNGAVAFGLGTIFSYLAWKLVEAAVWYAIKWAWRREWGLDE